MTNNKIMAMMFYVLFCFFISTDANATFKCTTSGNMVECNTTRPSFKIHRSGDVVTVDFSSSRNIPLVLSHSKSLAFKSVVGGWVSDDYPNGAASDHFLLNYNIYSTITCTLDDSAMKKCDSLIQDYIVGKSLVFSQATGEHGCIFIRSGINAGPGDANWSDVTWPSSSGITCSAAPPTDCVGDDCDTDEGGHPEPSLSCSVKTSSINLAFGNMAMGEALNKTVSNKINVNCNKAGAKLTMSLKNGGDSISLSNGMTAELTAGGKSLGSSISAVKGDNNVTISGALKGTEKEGAFSGSGVLVTDYQ